MCMVACGLGLPDVRPRGPVVTHSCLKQAGINNNVGVGSCFSLSTHFHLALKRKVRSRSLCQPVVK